MRMSITACLVGNLGRAEKRRWFLPEEASGAGLKALLDPLRRAGEPGAL